MLKVIKLQSVFQFYIHGQSYLKPHGLHSSHTFMYLQVITGLNTVNFSSYLLIDSSLFLLASDFVSTPCSFPDCAKLHVMPTSTGSPVVSMILWFLPFIETDGMLGLWIMSPASSLSLSLASPCLESLPGTHKIPLHDKCPPFCSRSVDTEGLAPIHSCSV